MLPSIGATNRKEGYMKVHYLAEVNSYRGKAHVWACSRQILVGFDPKRQTNDPLRVTCDKCRLIVRGEQDSNPVGSEQIV